MPDMKDVFGLPPLDRELEEERKERSNISEFNNRDPEQNARKIRQLFQEVFGSDHGKIVLGIILEDLYYFRDCGNDEARALNNYAKTLISQRLGFNDNKKRVDSLFSAD